MSDILRVSFLGGFECIYQNESISGNFSKRLQSLLAYLVLHRQTPQSRQQVAFLLWPDSSESQARTNLRRNLHTLRQVFPELEQFMAIETKSLQWRPEAPCEIDIAIFEQTAHNDAVLENLAALETALSVYKGPLLPNCYDEWIVSERDRLQQLCIQAHVDLMRSLQSQQEHSKIIRYAQQLLRLDPLSESAYSYLMEAHAASGDRTQAMQTYHRCMTTLREELGLDPSQSIQDLYQHLLEEPQTQPEATREDTSKAVHFDWGNAPDVSLFYGRNEELLTLEQWIVRDRCRVVMLLGMGGIGKTSLSVKLARSLADAAQFDIVIWRSLRNAPSLESLLGEMVPLILGHQETEPTLKHLMEGLRRSRCLLVLDNLETILQGEQRSGQYHPGYEAYGELLRLMGETNHQSCLLLTSREKTREFSALEGMDLPVRSHLLSGSPEAAMALLQAKGLEGTEQQRRDLCELYGHNPLALKIVATSIQDLFDGDIAAFQTPDAISFSGIDQLLAEQFDRCSALERTIMYWLAINREWTSITDLAEDIMPSVSRSALLEALESLMWRSLIEKQSGHYTQQPVVMEYVTAQLIRQVCDNILTLGSSAADAPQLCLFETHALLKAEGSDYIREIQIREILQPVLAGLAGKCGSPASSEPCLRQALEGIQADSRHQSSYAAGNLLNLLSQTNITLESYDFSGLALRQADLRRVNLHKCNLQGTDLSQAVFLETLSLPLALKFSPDGRLLAIGDAKGAVRIWNVEDGRNVLTCTGHTDWVWSLSFSPDGQTVASGSSDRTVKLWDLNTGQCLHTLQVHTAQVWSVAFHPTAPILASASEDRTINLWNTDTGACRTLDGHADWVRTVIFSPDGKTLASGSDDHTVKVWETATGECRQTLEGHTMRVWDVAYAPDGMLASSSSDRIIKLWNPKTGKCLRTLEGHQNWVRSLAFSPDAKILASGSEDQTLKLWNVATGNCQQTLREHHNWIRSVAFSPDGECFASGSGDNTVKLWRVDGQCRRTLQGYIDRVWSVAFSPDSSASSGILASANDDHQIKLWNLSDLSYRQTLSGHTNSVCAVAFAPAEDLLASGSEDHTVKLWDVRTGQCQQTLNGHTGRIWSVAFSAEGGLLASASEDYTIKLWDTQTGQCLRTLTGHTNWVCSVAFCPGDRLLLASASYDKTVKLWDPFTGECLQTLEGHSNWAWSVAFSPDGETLASGSGDHSIRLWNLKGECLKILEGHDSRVWSVAFSPDGETLASASSDKTVKLWEVKTGSCLHTLEGHTNLAWAVAFSTDGQHLASGSQDETIRLWQSQTGDCKAVLEGARPYDRTNILGAKGLTDAQRLSLKQLGAVEQTDVSATPSRSAAHVESSVSRKASPDLSAAPFIVGRQTEWEVLQRWLSEPQSSVLLLVGESGIGKTRLLKELGLAIANSSGQILQGRGFAAERARPFGIWLDVLHTEQDADALPSELSALFFEQGPEGETQRDRTRLFNAVGNYLKTLADQTPPLVVVLDDIQWLDEVSAALFHYVVRLLSHLPIKFACAARQQELEANTDACQLVKMLRRDRHLQTLSLAPLDRESTTLLAHSIHPEIDGEQIYTDSGGNPLFIVEMARAVAEGHTARSDTIETLVHDRLQQLDADTQDLLTWAAVMGRSFDPVQMTQIADCSLTHLLAAMEELEQQGILIPEQPSNGATGYLFAHDVIRQVAYQQLSEPRRQLMHRHIAQQLQTLTDPSLANDIAHHALLGQDAQLAAIALLTAAKQGLRLFAYTYAAYTAQRGIEQCQSLAPAPRIGLHLDLLKVRVLAGVSQGQALQIEADLNRLIHEARRLCLQDEEALGREVLITLNYEQDNLTGVHQHCVQAVEQGRSASPTVTAQTLAYTGWCLSDIGREMEKAEALLLEAQSLADRVGLDLFDIPCGLGCVRRYRGDYDAARPLLIRARQIAEDLQDHWRQFLCLSYLVMLELEAGNAVAALTFAQELKTAAAQLGEGSEGAVASALEALSQYWLEQPQASEVLAPSLDALKREDAQRMLAYVLTSAAEKDIELNRPQQTITRCEAALEAAQIVEQPSDVALARSILIQGYLISDETQLATAQFQHLTPDRNLSQRAKDAIATVSTQLGQPTPVT